MSTFVISFLLSSLLLLVIFQAKSVAEKLKRRGQKEDHKKLIMFLWEVVPMLLLSFVLIFGMKHSKNKRLAKHGNSRDSLSLVAFTRD